LSYEAFHFNVNVNIHNAGEDRRSSYVHQTGDSEFPPAVIYSIASARGPPLEDKSSILVGYMYLSCTKHIKFTVRISEHFNFVHAETDRLVH
jgi:hypothetical protein